MNAITDIIAAGSPEALAKLREPFPPHLISKLPKPYKRDSPKGNCNVCGGYHGLPAVHLDYVGHAALTDRLLDTDPAWFWEPAALTAEGLPAFDRTGGLWIKLTVCGVTRLGYGAADGKTGGDAVKEIIGDALRNAAMRFGAALDLWHKGDLHADEEDAPAAQPKHDSAPAKITEEQRQTLMDLALAVGVDAPTLCKKGGVQALPDLPADKFAAAKSWLEGKRRAAPASDILEDEVPY